MTEARSDLARVSRDLAPGAVVVVCGPWDGVDRALAYAAGLARRQRSRLVTVSLLSEAVSAAAGLAAAGPSAWPAVGALRACADEADEAVRELVGQIVDPETHAGHLTLRCRAAASLAALCRDARASLLVLPGGRPSVQRWVVRRQVRRCARTPVLLVP